MKRMVAHVMIVFLVFVATNASGNELLTNGGFETGTLTGWSGLNVAVTGTYAGISPKSGSFMAVLAPGPTTIPNVGTFSFGSSDAALFQPFSLAGYTSATISFDYNLQAFSLLPTSGTDNLVATIIVQLASAVDVGTVSFSLSDPIDNPGPQKSTVLGWTNYTATVTDLSGLPAGPLNIAFAVQNCPLGSSLCTGVTSGGDSGQLFSAYIDNVSINAVPEPEIYAMLVVGLGLMGWVGRRRKLLAA